MKALLKLTENTILMDCTPQELAGLLSLLQPRPKQSLPSSDTHPDEPPAAAEPVQEQDPEPTPQAPEPAPAEERVPIFLRRNALAIVGVPAFNLFHKRAKFLAYVAMIRREQNLRLMIDLTAYDLFPDLL